MNTYDIITIGGTTLDIFLDIHSASVQPTLDKKKTLLCLPYGSKIPIDTLNYSVGGNAANVAVGLARLSNNVAIYAHYGSDEISQKIFHTFTEEKVSTEYLVKDEGRTSSIGIALNFEGERTLFVHHIKRNHILPHLATPKWIYLTSVGDYWEKVYEQTLNFVQSTKTLFAFSPGSHQFKAGIQSFLPQVRVADILFVNKEEGKKIAESKSTNPSVLLSQLKKMGPRIVVMTDGEEGGYAIDEKGKKWHVEEFPTLSIERTGAGDGFASGFLASHLLGNPIAESLLWGAVNAAHVIRFIGAQKGLLATKDMKSLIESNRDRLAKKI